jgi:hypothetical protein
MKTADEIIRILSKMVETANVALNVAPTKACWYVVDGKLYCSDFTQQECADVGGKWGPEDMCPVVLPPDNGGSTQTGGT